MKKILILTTLFLITIILSSCRLLLDNKSVLPSDNSSLIEKSNSSNNSKIKFTLDFKDELAKGSQSISESYVTRDIPIGEKKTVKPGIYDLIITGGEYGHVKIARTATDEISSNYTGWTLSSSGKAYPSKVRVILLEGDILQLDYVGKFKLEAIPEVVKESTELSLGQFIVGRDIPSGKYRLSTNIELDSKYDLGVSMEIYVDDLGIRKERYSPKNNNVVVSLNEGEIITISFEGSIGKKGEDMKLIFTEIN